MKRTDANHKEIRQALRGVGYTVYDTSQSDLADFVVILKSGRAAIIVEVKPEEGGRVTPGEVRFMLRIVEPVYRMIQTPEDAIDIIREIEDSF